MPTLQMSDYRRNFIPGGHYFLTLVTHRRAPIFADVANVERLRQATSKVIQSDPFEIIAAVVLPDHLHWLIEMPPGDADFSTKVGKVKVAFTKSLPGRSFDINSESFSRLKHRDSNVWQRRFWEHTIRDQRDLERHLDYIHFNPVKHGHARCPHAWPFSSFPRWVEARVYPADWNCACLGLESPPPEFKEIAEFVGE